MTVVDMSVYEIPAENMVLSHWARRWLRWPVPGAREMPPELPPTGVLQDREEWERAVDHCRRLRLPLHLDKPKNWDSLAALSQVLRHLRGTNVAPENYAVLDGGTALYSALLPSLALYGITHLTGVSLELDGPLRRGPIRLLPADITDAPFLDAGFDAVTCLSVVEHGVPLERFFREMARLLKDGGLLVLSTDYDQDPPDVSGHVAFGAPVRIFSPREIRDMVGVAARHGLTLAGRLEPAHRTRPVHWASQGLDYTFVLLTFHRSARS